jgi:hypothetical protein
MLLFASKEYFTCVDVNKSWRRKTTLKIFFLLLIIGMRRLSKPLPWKYSETLIKI